MPKMNLVVAKRVSKSGNTFLSASIKVGQLAKRDYFFPNVNNVQAITGLSLKEIEDADVGVLFDKDIEV